MNEITVTAFDTLHFILICQVWHQMMVDVRGLMDGT